MTSLLKLYICGTPALENLRGCLTFAYTNIIAMLLGLLVSLRQMTTRLRLCVSNNVNLPEVEAEVYGLSSDSWKGLQCHRDPMLWSLISIHFGLPRLLVRLCIVGRC